ncbi:hypothetical protein GF318_04015 [Candidatus Micrarchaeota archaeon]|nr:hypothetical protein [Candidatus Micrarchaeota archaeon]
MRCLSRSRHRTAERKKPRRRMLRACAAAFALAASTYLIIPSSGKDATPAAPAVAETGNRKNPRRDSWPKHNREPPLQKPARGPDRRKIGALLNALSKNQVFRTSNTFTYDSLQCGFVPFDGSSFPRKAGQHPGTNTLKDDIMQLKGPGDVESLLSIINYFDSLNMEGLEHHYRKQYRDADYGDMVPEPECVQHVSRAKGCYISALVALKDIVMGGYAELGHVVDGLPERSRDYFIFATSGDMLFRYLVEPREQDFDSFEMHYLSLPDSLRKKYTAVFTSFIHLISQDDAETLFSTGAPVLNSLAPETRDLMVKLFDHYTLRILAETDENSARMIYGGDFRR